MKRGRPPKLTPEQAQEIRQHWHGGILSDKKYTRRDLAASYKVSIQTIDNVIHQRGHYAPVQALEEACSDI